MNLENSIDFKYRKFWFFLYSIVQKRCNRLPTKLDEIPGFSVNFGPKQNLRDISANFRASYCLDSSEISRTDSLRTFVGLEIPRESSLLPQIRGKLFRETSASLYTQNSWLLRLPTSQRNTWNFRCDLVFMPTATVATLLFPLSRCVSQSDQFSSIFICTHANNFKVNNDLH